MPRRNVPLGMMIGLGLDLSGAVYYGTRFSQLYTHGTNWQILQHRICCTVEIFWAMSERYG